MKETFILTNINDRELLRSLALKDKGSFNVRILNSFDLAKEALIRSGISVKEVKISNTKQECIVYELIKDIDYFKDSSYEDAKHIVKSLNYSRMLCRNNEDIKLNEVFSDGEFKEKNLAIKDVYNKYKQYLKDNNLIDDIGIINLAICKANVIEGDFISFKETKLEPLEEELINKLSNNSYSTKSIREYFGFKDTQLKGLSYDNGYGSVNEIEHILGTISKSKTPYEDVAIALVDNSYLCHFLVYKDTFNIPMTNGIGHDITLSNASKVLNLIDKWNKNYNSLDSLKELIYSPSFDTNRFFETTKLFELKPREINDIIKISGELRLSTFEDNRLQEYKDTLSSEEELKNYEYVSNIADELYKGYSYLIKTYTKIDNEELDINSINKICSYIDEYFLNIKDAKLEDIIDSINNLKVLRQLSKEKSIHITDLKGALSSIRKHLFICGLNAKVFPGSPSEDYLLLDSDLERFNEENVKYSLSKVQDNKDLLFNVLDNASSFNETIHLSYSGYNLSELKSENPSSMLFEVFKKEHGDNSKVEDLDKEIGEQHKYFDEDFISIKNVGVNYSKQKVVNEKEDYEDKYSKVSLNRTIYPSNAEKFYSCPFRFYLINVLGIEEPEENDSLRALPDNDSGTLVHACMEDYGNNPNWTIQEFKKNAENKFDNYFKRRIPVHTKNLTALRKEYLDMALNGYNNDPHNEVFKSEYRITNVKHDNTGLVFGGIIDRIEKLNDGTYQIVDYKTYKDIRNIEDDIETCFQVVLYAYLFEKQEGKKVSNLQYRYLRNVREINCKYDDIIKEQLESKLALIKEALDEGKFEHASDEDACKYCKFANICGKDKDKKDMEVEE